MRLILSILFSLFLSNTLAQEFNVDSWDYYVSDKNYKNVIEELKVLHPLIYEGMLADFLYSYPGDRGVKAIEIASPFYSDSTITSEEFQILNLLGCAFRLAYDRKSYRKSFKGNLNLNFGLPIYYHFYFRSFENAKDDKSIDVLKEAVYKSIISNKDFTDGKLQDKIDAWIEIEENKEYIEKLTQLNK